MTRFLAPVALALATLATNAAEPEAALAFTDQFGRRHDLSDHRGEVVVLVYGDRKAADACGRLGAALHVAFHPAAANLPQAQARKAAVRPLPDGRTPEVRVIPVACTGSLPTLLRPVLVGQFRKAEPDVPVWLDFDDAMKARYGMTASVPNAVVFDARGRLRRRTAGELTDAERQSLIDEIERLRHDAAAE